MLTRLKALWNLLTRRNFFLVTVYRTKDKMISSANWDIDYPTSQLGLVSKAIATQSLNICNSIQEEIKKNGTEKTD